VCSHHGQDFWTCPDFGVVRFESGAYGIPIRDGGLSFYSIEFCPWCGAKLEQQ
jgi:hypothetical protein